MSKKLFNQTHALQGQLSFQPLLRLWNKVAKYNDHFASKVCQDLYQRFSTIPELAMSVVDPKSLLFHRTLLEEAFATIFPSAFYREEQLYSISAPFSNKSIYSSCLFESTYLDSDGNFFLGSGNELKKNISGAQINLAYKLILKKWYNAELIEGGSFISYYTGHDINTNSYIQLQWDTRFIDITAVCEPPKLPEELLAECHGASDLLQFPELSKFLRLDNFIFKGFVITHIGEVPELEAVNNIRDLLQMEDIFENEPLLSELKNQIRYLLGLHEAEIGFTVLYDGKRDEEIQTINPASILLQDAKSKIDLFVLCNELKEVLHQHSGNYLWLKSEVPPKNTIEERLYKLGLESAAIISLYYNKVAIGCLELFTKQGKRVDKKVLGRLEYVQELIQFAIHLYRYRVQTKVNDIVQKHFTAIQPDVAWKFNNAAVKYLKKQSADPHAGMEAIIFEGIIPIYGAIDIRNSSGERVRAVQQDLLQQLGLINNILASVQNSPVQNFTSMQVAVNSYTNNITGSVKESDLHQVQHFLKKDIPGFLNSLKMATPDLSVAIESYTQKLDQESKLLTVSQKGFEESVEKINRHIVSSLIKAQEEMQKIYPHYFERFVTDGVEYNIYVGESITPHKVLSNGLISSIRFSHLFFMAQIVRELNQLRPELAKPLQTTQMMLAYNKPVTIRFRTDERKFDMDGVRDTHFEIIKKRIEKVKVKGTNQRLTQPGTIAIVYSIEEEETEYLRFIEVLLAHGVLTGEIEKLELEELPGISGLKGLRTAVKLISNSMLDV